MSDASERPNFFDLLELDLNEPFHEVALREQIKKKQRQWSNQINSSIGKKQEQFKGYLALLKDIERVMLNERGYREERARKIQSGEQDRQRALVNLRRSIEIKASGGHLRRSDVDDLAAAYPLLSRAEILAEITVPIRESDETSLPPLPEQLDASEALAIAERLAILHQPDLYSLLRTVDASVSPATPCDALITATNTFISEARKPMGDSAEKNAKLDVGGRALVIFGSEEKRRRYDATLQLAGANDLVREYEENCATGVSGEQYELFLRDARGKGYDTQLAEALLFNMAAKRGLTVARVIDARKSVDEMIRCGVPGCATLNRPDAEFCVACGQALYATCPDCGADRLPADAIACTSCGYMLGDRFAVNLMLDQAGEQLDAGELGPATELIQKIRVRWRPKRADERIERLDKLDDRLQALREEQQRKADELQLEIDRLAEDIGARRYVAARERLLRLPDDIPHRAEYVAEANRAIATADALLKRAVDSTTDDEVERNCLAALDQCADHEKARATLRTLPPLAPTEASARADDSRVVVDWNLSRSHDVVYVVARRYLAPELAPSAEIEIGRLDRPPYTDVGPRPGIPISYTVYADREGTRSVVGASADVMLTPSATDLRAVPGDSVIVLEWANPQHVARVVVRRTDQDLARTEDGGSSVATLTPASARDTAVVNGREYCYSVFCQYMDAAGRLCTAPAASVRMRPQKPPSPVEHLRVHTGTPPGAAGIRIDIAWDPLPEPGARVVVLKSSFSLGLRPGSVLMPGELTRYQKANEHNATSAVDAVLSAQKRWYTPVVILNGIGYVGSEWEYDCIADVTDLRPVHHGLPLRLQWTWPRDCARVWLAYDEEPLPESIRHMSNPVVVTKDSYDRLGYYELADVRERDLYVAVMAEAQGANGAALIGPGARLLVRLASVVTLTYELIEERGWFGGARQRALIVRVNRPCLLPGLVMLTSPSNIPEQRTLGSDTRVALHVEPGRRVGREIRIPLTTTHIRSGTYYKLFLEADADAERYNVIAPSRDKLYVP